MILGLVLLGMLGFAGCSRQKTVVIPGVGKTTVKEGRAGGAKEVTIENEKAKIKINYETAIPEKELGLPIYPGATVESSSDVSASNTGKGGGNVKQVFLTTGDSVDTVKAYYEKNINKTGQSSSDANQMNVDGNEMTQIVMQYGEKEQRLVVISRQKGRSETRIMLQKTTE